MNEQRHETTRTRCTHGMLVVVLAACVPSSRTTSPSSIDLDPTGAKVSASASHPAASIPPGPRPPLGAPGLSETETETETEPQPHEPARADPFEMTFVGDMIFGRYRSDGFDPIVSEQFDVFAAVSPLLQSHLVVGNLETPLVHELPADNPIPSPHRFGASAQMARPLAQARFDAVSLANNHAYDLRRAGLEQTPQILAAMGIVGLGSVPPQPPALRVQTIERAGWRVGFVAVATRLNGPRPRGLPPIPLVPTLELYARLGPLVERARADHDLLVVLVHWGEEGRPTPTAAQRSVARRLVDAGVDLIVGHHPHVLQGIESRGAGIIAYSLGNFLFDNTSPRQRQTAILRVRARQGRCFDAVIVHPVLIDRLPVEHPTPAAGARGQPIKDRVRALSEPWGTRFTDDADALVLDGPGCP